MKPYRRLLAALASAAALVTSSGCITVLTSINPESDGTFVITGSHNGGVRGSAAGVERPPDSGGGGLGWRLV